MISRSALIYLSQHEGLKDFATRFKFFKKLTTRFVAGEDIDEAVEAIRKINSVGCSASFDHLNESVNSAEETKSEVTEYLHILEQIDATGINSNASIKLSQFGLEIDSELAYKNARTVVAEAARREVEECEVVLLREVLDALKQAFAMRGEKRAQGGRIGDEEV